MSKLQLNTLSGSSPPPPVSGQTIATGWLDGSDEQQAIWQEMVKGNRHLLVNAVAGSGKSTTCAEGSKRVRAVAPGRTITYLAFNKHVQLAMQSLMDGKGMARTYHSIGMAAVASTFGATKFNDHRMWPVIEAFRQWKDGEYLIQSGLRSLSAVAKQYEGAGKADLEYMIDNHGLDLGSEDIEAEVVGLMPELMQKAATCFVSGKVAEIDYNDMCWLPMVLNLRLPRAGLVLCDESQDLNQVQQWMAIRAGEKLAIVGDRNQAIYGFRGADNHSMDNLAAKAGKLAGKEVVEFPLSYTRRCPHSHVRLAQVVVPGIHALPGAVDGVTGIRTLKAVVSDAGPGEMIICRSNAPLITVAHRLLAEGVRAVIKGKDVGAAILRLLDQSEKGATLAQAIADAQDYTYRQVTRFTLMDGDKGRMRAQIAEDRLACLEAAAEGCGTVKQLRDKLKMLFSDEEGDGSQVVTLSTIHKAKGLESVKVTVLSPHLLPHPYASRARELEQEMNCLYVALTRSKHELYFVDQLPPPLQDAGIRL